jgi:hypothetical protein
MAKKNQYSPEPTQDPAKRGQQIRNAIVNKRIKYNEITDDILMLIDETVALEQREVKKTA